MGGGREGKGREGGTGRGSSLRARSLAAGLGGRNGWGGAVRVIARRLDPGEVFAAQHNFFSSYFYKILGSK